MYKDTLTVDTRPIVVTTLLRPFAKGTVLAYELVLRRSQGERVYDRSLSFLNGTDARDLANAFNIPLEDAR